MENKNYDLSQVYIGKVIDNADPDNIGRVKVNVFNIHEVEETSGLPWAYCLLNGKQLIVPEVDDYVAIIFLNGSILQPAYLGVLNTKQIAFNSADKQTSKDIVYESRDHNVSIVEETGGTLETKAETKVVNETTTIGNTTKIEQESGKITIKGSAAEGTVELGNSIALSQNVVLNDKLTMYLNILVAKLNLNVAMYGTHTHVTIFPGSPDTPTPMQQLTVMGPSEIKSEHVKATTNIPTGY